MAPHGHVCLMREVATCDLVHCNCRSLPEQRNPDLSSTINVDVITIQGGGVVLQNLLAFESVTLG